MDNENNVVHLHITVPGDTPVIEIAKAVANSGGKIEGVMDTDGEDLPPAA